MRLKSVKDLMPGLLEGMYDDQKIVISKDYLTLNYSYPYEISLDRIKTPEDVLGWVTHLADKNWMTKERLQNFIRKCEEVNNAHYNCG